MEKPELLSKEDYSLIHKDIAKKLLSTNNESGIQYHEPMLKLTHYVQNLRKKIIKIN